MPMKTPKNSPKPESEFLAFVEVVKALRGPNGCPWDKEQTHKSLTPYALEEAHELCHAIDTENDSDIKEELGDLLLQVVLHAQLAQERGAFDITEVTQTIREKMIRRHPHVFPSENEDGATATKITSQEVITQWDKIKALEKNQSDPSQGTKLKSPFEGIPLTLSALIRSQKIGAKTIRYNFDWSHPEEVLAKIEEELQELKEAFLARSGQPDAMAAIEHEMGDLLFSIAQLGRHLKLDAEQSLRLTNLRFEKRFLRMRELAQERGQDFESLPLSELETLWKQAKTEERN